MFIDKQKQWCSEVFICTCAASQEILGVEGATPSRFLELNFELPSTRLGIFDVSGRQGIVTIWAGSVKMSVGVVGSDVAAWQRSQDVFCLAPRQHRFLSVHAHTPSQGVPSFFPPILQQPLPESPAFPHSLGNHIYITQTTGFGCTYERLSFRLRMEHSNSRRAPAKLVLPYPLDYFERLAILRKIAGRSDILSVAQMPPSGACCPNGPL